jgi:UDP-3-O-[3-hydroxymyristoyl] glucosamine N-acyltransferase
MPKVKELLQKVPTARLVGKEETTVTSLIPLDPANTNPEALMWVNEKNVALAAQVSCGVIICPESFTAFQPGCHYIITPQPRLAFQRILEEFFVHKPEPVISKKAVIDRTVVMGQRAHIGDHVVIEAGCILGDDVSIDHNTVIKRDTIIGHQVKIGSNCTIGGIGFGYEKDETGTYQVIHHIGNVVLKDHVEIGNNTCVDRAVLGSTILHEHVKVDNLVHIAHGVTIGRNSLIIANTMIGGSTHIGENVWVAPSASILNKKQVGSNSVLGMGAVVLKDVADGQTIVGNPGKPLTKNS